MRKRNWLRLVFTFLVLTKIASSQETGQLEVLKETSNYFETNCYLIIDQQSKEAALVDASEKIDSLLSIIHKQNLHLKYIFITHCHPDHIYGLPALKKIFPKAKVCFSKAEYKAMLTVYANWQECYPEQVVKVLMSNRDIYKITSMDYNQIGEPDIWVSEGDLLNLGKHQIKTISVPGHAPGSVCYYSYDVAFTGDELFYKGVGNTQKYPNSSFIKQIQSVRKLYNLLDDETTVYPGHGPSTTIGSEKTENQNISLKEAIQ